VSFSFHQPAFLDFDILRENFTATPPPSAFSLFPPFLFFFPFSTSIPPVRVSRRSHCKTAPFSPRSRGSTIILARGARRRFRSADAIIRISLPLLIPPPLFRDHASRSCRSRRGSNDRVLNADFNHPHSRIDHSPLSLLLPPSPPPLPPPRSPPRSPPRPGPSPFPVSLLFLSRASRAKNSRGRPR